MGISDIPIAPPIAVKDTPHPRKLTTFNDARALTDELLAQRRTATWREMGHRLDAVKTEEDAIEAIGALRELLSIEGLLESSSSSAA